MALLDWTIIAGIALVVVFLLLLLIFLIQYVANKKVIADLERKKSKNKKRNKRNKQKIYKLQKNQKKKIKGLVLLIVLTVLTGLGTAYAKFYQSTNLTNIDSENVVYGYYLLNQMEGQLNNSQTMEEKKRDKNIHALAIQMSSYASKKGSDRGTEEAQILLNRYYARLGQLGINIAATKFIDYEATEALRKEYIEDINKVKNYQRKVFDYYKVNEDLMQQEK